MSAKKKDYEYSVEFGPFGYVYRPILPNVEIITNGKIFSTEGLLDTGSGDVAINLGIAKGFFGLDISKFPQIPVGGFGGEDKVGFCSNVTIRLKDLDFEYETPVVFSEFSTQLVLGDSFFENFNVILERSKSKFTLIKIPRLGK